MRKAATILLIILSMCFTANAQDPHFSQFSNVCFHNNPAKAGFSANKFRFSANTKIQWNSVSDPYQTYLAGADFALSKRPSHYDIIGMGVDFISDKAGTSNFSTNGIGLNLSYIKSLNNFNDHFLTAGIGVSYHQRSIDINNLSFDNQFNGSYYDATLPADENIVDLNFWYPSISLGTYYFRKINIHQDFSAGISVQNINRPNQSHYGNEEVRLKTKWNGEICYSIDILQQQSISPQIFYSMQGKLRELIFGATYSMGNENKMFSAGLFYRTADALIFLGQMKIQNYTLGISYDMNVSKLVPASNLRGGFEFSLIAEINNSKKKPKIIPCPIF